MSRLTLRLPESLHVQLKETAKREGVSLNQYVVYALAQQAAPSLSVFRHSDEDVKEQTRAFYEHLDKAPKATDAQVRAFLEARASEESDLDPDVVAKFEALTR